MPDCGEDALSAMRGRRRETRLAGTCPVARESCGVFQRRRARSQRHHLPLRLRASFVIVAVAFYRCDVHVFRTKPRSARSSAWPALVRTACCHAIARPIQPPLRLVYLTHNIIKFNMAYIHFILPNLIVQCEDLYEPISCLLPEVAASPAQHCT
jgi:hypothetical protein